MPSNENIPTIEVNRRMILVEKVPLELKIHPINWWQIFLWTFILLVETNWHHLASHSTRMNSVFYLRSKQGRELAVLIAHCSKSQCFFGSIKLKFIKPRCLQYVLCVCIFAKYTNGNGYCSNQLGETTIYHDWWELTFYVDSDHTKYDISVFTLIWCL